MWRDRSSELSPDNTDMTSDHHPRRSHRHSAGHVQKKVEGQVSFISFTLSAFGSQFWDQIVHAFESSASPSDFGLFILVFLAEPQLRIFHGTYCTDIHSTMKRGRWHAKDLVKVGAKVLCIVCLLLSGGFLALKGCRIHQSKSLMLGTQRRTWSVGL